MSLEDLYCEAAKAVGDIVDFDEVPAGRRRGSLQRLKDEIERWIAVLKEAPKAKRRKRAHG